MLLEFSMWQAIKYNICHMMAFSIFFSLKSHLFNVFSLLVFVYNNFYEFMIYKKNTKAKGRNGEGKGESV